MGRQALEDGYAALQERLEAAVSALEEVSQLLDASPSSGVTAQARAIARGAALAGIRAARS